MITFLLLLSALCLSTVAGYYSIIGMTTIFAASWWPVVIMTGTLEFSKVVVASWLYRNWHKTPVLLRTYLTASVIVLMCITSLGIFGYLSKAHIDQGLSMGDNTLEIAQLEQQIQFENKSIEDNRKVISQMDDAVSSILSQSVSETAQKANRGSAMAAQAAKLRDKQKVDRTDISKAINEANKKVRELSSEKLKLEQAKLKLEAEVGPIKYIAQMMYGDNPDKNLLEKAVRYVIILIIFVFDPLAVLMLIAANMDLVNKRNNPETDDFKKKDNDVDSVDSTEINTGFKFINIDEIDTQAPTPKIEEPTVEEVNALLEEVEQELPILPSEDVSDILDDDIIESVSNEVNDESTVVNFLDTNELDEAITEINDENGPTSKNRPEPTLGKKPDNILQTIKEYHNVRLDDARRTLK